jgi:hypothetical protein
MKVSVTPWDLFPRVRPLTGRILSLWDILLLKEMGTEGEISKREGGGCPVMGRGHASRRHKPHPEDHPQKTGLARSRCCPA